MGLDIIAISKIEFVKPFESYEEFDNYAGEKDFHFIVQKGLAHPRSFEGLEDGIYKGKGSSYNFRAGSYSSYNLWRDILARVIMGVPAKEVWTSPGAYRMFPFFELIEFSDAEGGISGASLERLAKDSKDSYKEAKKKIQALSKDGSDLGYSASAWLEGYKNFMKAFNLAAPKGVIIFA